MGWGGGGCIWSGEMEGVHRREGGGRRRDAYGEGGGVVHMVCRDGGMHMEVGGGLDAHLLCKTPRQPQIHTDNTLPFFFNGISADNKMNEKTCVGKCSPLCDAARLP